jgi:hypothetical protein
MDKERETLWHEHWKAAKAAKEERRRANREAWASSVHNSHNRHKEDAIAANLGLEAEAETGGSASLRKMRAIMANEAIPLYRRLDAAEVLLTYELGPGAAAGADPETVAAVSYRFLKLVADAAETPESLKFRALRSVVAIENQRASIKSTAVEYDAKKRLLIALCNAERGRVLRAAGAWPAVIERNAPWFLEASDDIEAPAGWFSDAWHWPSQSFAGGLDRSADIGSFKQVLIGIRARNRVDAFDALMEGFLASTGQNRDTER